MLQPTSSRIRWLAALVVLSLLAGTETPRAAAVPPAGAPITTAPSPWLLRHPARQDVPGSVLLVTTTVDELNTDGDCSLREALRAANTDTAVDACGAGREADTITLPKGTYALTRAGRDEDAAQTGDLDITAPLTVSGAGQAVTIIDANALDRVLENSAADVTLADLTLRNGRVEGVSSSGPGGILNHGTLTLTRITVTGNHDLRTVAVDNDPVGGISNSGTLTLTRSTVSRNSSIDVGGLYNTGRVTLAQSTIEANSGYYGSGGILNEHTLTIADSHIRDNRSGATGGISNAQAGTLMLTRSIISGNSSDGISSPVGGIANGGTASITDSLINDNFSRYGVGGIVAGTMTITNSTISHNFAVDRGAGIVGGSTLRIVNSTITANSMFTDDASAAGISGAATIANSIVAGNLSGGKPSDCYGTLTSQGYNLIGTTRACQVTGDATGNLLNVEPQLGPLQDNGGATPTFALLPRSPAIDAGSPAASGTGAGACAATDQRGVVRPQDGNRDGVARCDIGAYELAPPVTAYALTSANELVTFASDVPERLLARTAVTGLLPGEGLIGIEVRPATGQLYALGSTSRLYRIDGTTGRATAVGSAPFAPPLDGHVFGLDVDPTTDELHVVSDRGQHLRLDLDTGTVLGVEPRLRYAAGDPNASRPTGLDGAAFTAGVSPTLYLLDSANDALTEVRDGALHTVGPLGVAVEPLIGFDIAPSGQAYAALRADDGIAGAVLVSINLETGRLTSLGRIGPGERVRGLAIAVPR